MAEVDMEIDTSHTNGLELEADDDLIDYDSDAEGINEKAEVLAEEHHARAEHSTEDASLQSEAAIVNAESTAVNVENKLSSSHTATNNGGDEDTALGETTDHHDHTTTDLIDTGETSEHDQEDVADEINYDFADGQDDDSDQGLGGDASYSGDLEAEAHDGFDLGAEQATTEGAQTLVIEDEVLDNVGIHTGSHAETQPFDHTAEEAEDARDEITWEENDEAEADGDLASAPVDTLSATGTSAANEGNEPSYMSINEVDDDAAHGHEVADDKDPVNGEAVDGSQYEAEVEEDTHATQHPSLTDDGDDTSAQVDGLVDRPPDKEASAGDFPRITVQYRGDEYPCFSNSSEGFFSEISVVEDSISKLLEGFREELSDEIAPEDELVLQVDELGLEFSESSQHEILSGITLRQILEIFDLLVKNENPDKTRTLYTYLFTKPSTSKRFESLSESAAAGRGLNEVVHLFESPITHGQTTTDDQDNINAFEELDNYDSIVDDSGEGAHETLEDEKDDNDTANHEKTPVQQLENVEGADDAEDFDHYADEESHHVMGASGGDLVDESELMTGMTTDVDPIGLADDETLLKLAAGSAFDAGQADASNDWEGNHIVNEPEATDPGTAATSTTTTMNEISTAAYVDDIDLNTTEDHVGDTEAHDTEDMAEIDWRDEPTYVDDDGTASQTAAKRNRADDEVDVDGQHDTKRRRSS